MEKKNKKAILLVSILLVGVGISFAYFAGTSLFGGTGSKTEGITASIHGATVNVEGGLAFNDLDILPGHQTVSSIKVTATGNNELIPYNLIWNGTNSLNTPLEFKVYKTSKEVDVSVTCDKKTKVENGYQILNEECTISNLDKLGSVISRGTIEKATSITKVILAEEEFITATSDGDTKYYYVILEYPNLDEEQNADMGGSFEGTVTVEESNAKPDINILAIQIEQEDGTYKKVEDIPQEGYWFNEEKSVCSNDAIPNWSNNKLIIENLTKNGTNCYLYFDKPVNAILADVIPKESPEEGFSGPAITGEGIYKAQDNDGNTYYFRGAVENNYVKFANKYWRIIRINGDGTIRLIYQGTSETSNDNSLSGAFNSGYSDNMYVGFKYTSGEVHGKGTNSTILNALNSWYEENLKSYENNIDLDAGFCNDRDPYTNSLGTTSRVGTNTTETTYGAKTRLDLYNGSLSKPTFRCKTESDLFTTVRSNKGNKTLNNPIGLITADEVAYAGGYYITSNTSYYLYYVNYNGWTMSPYSYNSGNRASVFVIGINGNLAYNRVDQSCYIKPVINLKANTKFKYDNESTKGTMNDPYVVE